MKIRDFVKKYFSVLLSLRLFCLKLILKYFPIYMSKKYYRLKMDKKLDLDNPLDLNEKIQWLKLYSDTTLWSDLADKYKVRDFVKKKGLVFILNELYGVWNDPYDIDFDKLPNQFVLKMNNGYGDVILVEDKSMIDTVKVRSDLYKYLNRSFGVYTVEPHYLKIKPRIICEKMLKDTSGVSSSLIDYKFHCSYGKILFLLICFDREIRKHTELMVYDIETWKPKYEYMREVSLSCMKEIPKPKSLDIMMKYASVLSNNIPFVRVDFYDVDGFPVFGEMTFTPAAGCIRYLTEQFLNDVGGQIDLSKVGKNY